MTLAAFFHLRERLDAALWGLRKSLAGRMAPAYRRRLDRVLFIGVTGSCGKTTAKDFIYAVLSTQRRGRRNELTLNRNQNIAMSILRMRRGDEFLVQEVGVEAPGSIDASLRVLRPQVGAVTVIGLDHYRAFRTPEAIAAEKGKLIACLPPDGLAVLNADDPLVLGMRALTAARCITYGRSPEADVRAEDVRSVWPDRLGFTLLHSGRRVPVQTQLCGDFWLTSVLCGLAAGLALDVPLEDAVRAVEAVPPPPGRMYPVAFPDGVTIIRDDWKAPLWTVAPTLAFMKAAKADRKIIVLGNISDYPGGADRKYPAVARQAAEAADHVFFVGPQARLAMKAEKHVGPDRLRAFESPRAAHEFLQSFLRGGDLVLIKGSNRADHLERLTLARDKPVACWRTDCGIGEFCSRCRLLYRAAGMKGRAAAQRG